jgi:hypothetical protein
LNDADTVLITNAPVFLRDLLMIVVASNCEIKFAQNESRKAVTKTAIKKI